MYVFARYLRDNGFIFRKEEGWGVLPLVAMILWFALVSMTLSAGLGQFLSGEVFPYQGFLIFLVSGIAFSVAIFPKLSAEYSETLPKLSGTNLEWIIVLPAWLWILVVIGLAVFNVGND